MSFCLSASAPLPLQRDKAILRRELPNLRPECLRVLEVSTVLLQMCAAAGLTLYDVATVMTRPFLDIDEEPSELERICAYARQCIEVRCCWPCGLCCGRAHLLNHPCVPSTWRSPMLMPACP